MNFGKMCISAVAVLGLAGLASAQTFSNPAPITIPGTGTSGPASLYPSSITVSGLGAGPWDVDVTLSGLSHTFPDDLDILLVSPSGTCILMSDAGGATDIVGIDLIFSDGSPSLPDGTVISGGTYAPTNFGTGDTWPAPAPAGPYGSSLNALGAGTVNGTWSLYIQDDVGGDIGSLAGGWSITFTPAPGALALLGLAGLVGTRRRRSA